MPISIVAGGQYGSEGKGKVALHLARVRRARAVVRVGGTNSGHTAVASDGERAILRQLPTATLAGNSLLVLPPGSYIDPSVLLREVHRYGVSPDRLKIDPDAAIITQADVAAETSSGLTKRIGSTASGTGSTVARRVSRDGTLTRAKQVPELAEFLCDTLDVCSGLVRAGERVIIEGTQGYGLSVLHGGHEDFATSRDTTAAGFLSESGLSPLDVDEVALVLRSFPIRVSGRSGTLPRETSWEQVAQLAGRPGLIERTSVTKQVRRIGNFDGDVVRRALAANNPSTLVLNHLDYVANAADPSFWRLAWRFVRRIEEEIGREVDLLGLGPDAFIERSALISRLTGNAVEGALQGSSA